MKKGIEKRCFELWAKIVKAGKRCEFCGSTFRLEAHHILGRDIKAEFLFDTKLGACACYKCHAGEMRKDHKKEMQEKIKIKSPSKYEYAMSVKDKARVTCLDQKPDYEEILNNLKKELKEIK